MPFFISKFLNKSTHTMNTIRDYDISVGLRSIQLVKEFHETFNHPINPLQNRVATDLASVDEDLISLRHALIAEECKETITAAANNDLVEVIDGLCDMQYVLAGAALVFGVGHTLHGANRYDNYDVKHTLGKSQGIGWHLLTIQKVNDEFLNQLNNIEGVGAFTRMIEMQDQIFKAAMVIGLKPKAFLNVFTHVHESNMSKAATNPLELGLTVARYLELGTSKFEFERKGKAFIVKNLEGKVLKCAEYSPVSKEYFNDVIKEYEIELR